MRLICPNCEAQYDVSDDAIPAGGRDVQCSNCQQTWFQTEKPAVPGRDTSRPLPNVELTNNKADKQDAGGERATPSPNAASRKGLDDAVAKILQEEASRDSKTPNGIPGSEATKPPATQAETATEVVDANETLKRIAQMTEAEGGTRAGVVSTTAAAAAVADANLRSIPDINEMNAALRARAQASDTSGLTETEKKEAVQRSGFRRGFFFVLLVFVVLIAPYFFAEVITESLPQTRGFMADYLNTVDQIRVRLNDLFSGLSSG